MALLSGGLDSILAVRLILGQGVPVVAIRYLTHFGCDADGSGSCGKDVSPLVKMWGPLGLEIKYCHLGETFIEMVRSPKFGRGKNMNPCIDCRVIMLEWARDVMEKEEACCIVTGEVLSQRPMSQTRPEFRRIEKETGLQGMILRPLCAKLLEPTIAEQEGLIDRERLLDISGRSRNRQLELAEKYGIEEIPQPAGGCLLTDPGYSARLSELWEHDPDAGAADINLLRVGRHFRPRPHAKIVVGRREEENVQLELMAREGDALIRLKDYVGPVTLVRGKYDREDLELAAALTIRYGDVPNRAEGPRAGTLVEIRGGETFTVETNGARDADFSDIRIGVR